MKNEWLELPNFLAKLTDKSVYIRSKHDEKFTYRVSGKYHKLIKLFAHISFPTMKLIPLMKMLVKMNTFVVETRTTQNKKTGEWLWAPGYQRTPEFPSGTLGGLNAFGTTFSGEFNEDGRPIMMGRNMNAQNAGALKGMKTSGDIEHQENRPKFDDDELAILRKQKADYEARKWDLGQKEEVIRA